MCVFNSKQLAGSYDRASSEQSQEILNQKIQGFDYTTLTPQVRVLVQDKTFELKSLIRRSAQDIINIGQNLIEIKEQLGHGNFRTWLKAEFNWSVRTATRFMQVATKFKRANLAYLNIAVSALYLLAETSTPEEIREQALELAKQGENISHTKVKEMITQSKKLPQSDTSKMVSIKLSGQHEEDSLLTSVMQEQSQNIPFELETKNEAEVLPKAMGEISPTIQSHKKLKDKGFEKIDSLCKEDSEVKTELKPGQNVHIRILNIQHNNSEFPSNITQTFEMNFANICIDFEGKPEDLIVLFKQMQNNPGFTEKVIQEAKSQTVNNNT